MAAIYTGTKNLTVGAIFQNPISFAGDPSRPSVSNVIVSPTLTYNLPAGWFAGYSGFNWDFNWKNGGAATIPAGLQVGKVFAVGDQPFSLSLEAGYNVVRPKTTSPPATSAGVPASTIGTPGWMIGLEFNVIFGEHKKTFNERKKAE